MNILPALILLTTIKLYLCENIKEIFEKINVQTEKFNAIAAEITWESSVKPYNQELVYKSDVFQKENIKWTQKICDKLERLEKYKSFNRTQLRQKYLLCRGPKYTYDEARFITDLYQELQTIYTEATICIPTEENVSSTNLTEIETAIEKYLNIGDEFHKRIYRWSDSKKFSIRNAITKIKDNKNSVKHIAGDSKLLCLKGEDDFQKVMEFSRNERGLKWVWLVWREKVGPPMKEPYRRLVEVENIAAIRNGYPDIGASWREELEIPNLRKTCRNLYEDVKPLYTLLHGVVRYYLRKKYGHVVPERGPVPAHLLGDLWSQSWESISDLIVPRTINLDESITKLNWTVYHMVKRAEDFYQSLGLPPMTDSFWQNSVFIRESNDTRCHGTAADMFVKGDFRLLYCSKTTMKDFNVLHHELGHIQYYMAYEQQPTLFRQANMALHEAIGDTIMFAVMTPQHLHRLGLINDTMLYNNNEIIKENYVKEDTNLNKKENFEDLFDDEQNLNVKVEDKPVIDTENGIGIKYANKGDFKRFKTEKDRIFNKKNSNDENDKDKGEEKSFAEIAENISLNEERIWKEDPDERINLSTAEQLLLKQALNKVPQIPFSLLIDEYRWQYFSGDISSRYLNNAFWKMSVELSGIAPPGKRGEYEFDVGAKYHVPDNTPYIRYFLSTYLQHHLVETLCKAAVFGRRGVKASLPDTITLHTCDVYGSKAAGKLLKDIMSRGHSQHWSQILQETTGQDNITAAPLLRYYRPLVEVLEKLVRKHNIPIGW